MDIVISPYKDGKKFKNAAKQTELSMFGNYQSLALVSRQLYIDIVGGALLYRFATFSFNSPMCTYFPQVLRRLVYFCSSSTDLRPHSHEELPLCHQSCSQNRHPQRENPCQSHQSHSLNFEQWYVQDARRTIKSVVARD